MNGLVPELVSTACARSLDTPALHFATQPSPTRSPGTIQCWECDAQHYSIPKCLRGARLWTWCLPPSRPLSTTILRVLDDAATFRWRHTYGTTFHHPCARFGRVRTSAGGPASDLASTASSEHLDIATTRRCSHFRVRSTAPQYSPLLTYVISASPDLCDALSTGPGCAGQFQDLNCPIADSAAARRCSRVKTGSTARYDSQLPIRAISGSPDARTTCTSPPGTPILPLSISRRRGHAATPKRTRRLDGTLDYWPG